MLSDENGDVLVFYCCIRNDHNCGSLKQHECITHSSVGHTSGMDHLGSLLWVSQGQY